MKDQNRFIVTSILEPIGYGAAVIDKKYHIIEANQLFLRYIKWPSEEVINSIKSYSTQTDHRREELNLDGHQIPYYLIDDEEDHFLFLFKAYQEDDLLNQMSRVLIENVSNGIQVADTKGNMRIFNKAQGAIDGLSAADCIGKHITEIYDLDNDTSWHFIVQRTMQPIFNQRQNYETRSGNKVDVVSNTIPLLDHGKLLGSAAIAQDYSLMQQLIEKNIHLEKKLVEQQSREEQPGSKNLSLHYTFDNIITKNKKMMQIIEQGKQVAQNESNVLIVGETGTGKELFAQSIHSHSKRKKGPFLAINCAAIPETLLEGLLFGTVKGAFTGSINNPGLFEQASGGTIFLDEINSMSYMLQAKLLRVLEEHTVMRVGDNKNIPVDGRILASCNEDPYEAIKESKLRSDLFYRLSVVCLRLPPLREHMDDIDLLCHFYIKRFNHDLEKNVLGLEEDVRALFYAYHWPGNTRELKHILESAMNIIDGQANYLDKTVLPEYFLNVEFDQKTETILEDTIKTKEIRTRRDLLLAKDEKEREQILHYLQETDGNICKAAELMNIKRQTLMYKMKKLGI